MSGTRDAIQVSRALFSKATLQDGPLGGERDRARAQGAGRVEGITYRQ